MGCVWSTLAILLRRSIVIQHMSENILSILQSLGHFCVVAVQGLAERHDRTFSLLINISNKTIVRIQKNLCVVLEVNLHDLVAQAEHDSVTSAHPLLHVH